MLDAPEPIKMNIANERMEMGSSLLRVEFLVTDGVDF
jgi:hypothetical protein